MANADVDVLLDGKTEDDLGVRFGHLTLHETLAGHASFSIECLALDEGDAAALSGSQPNLDRLFEMIGKPFKVTIHTPDRQAARQTLEFEGLVTDARGTRQRGGGYEVVLEGRSPTILMDLEPRFQYGHGTEGGLGLQDWLKAATSDYGSLCSVQVKENPVIDYGMQFAETDFNFVTRVAERAALWCYYDGKALRITNELPAGQTQLTMAATSEENALDSFSISAGMVPSSFGLDTFNDDKREALAKATDDVALAGTLHPWAQRVKKAAEERETQVHSVLAERHFASASELRGYVENL
jgi:uncharacterized protein involved in type VI secretion and phage assembly